MADINKMEKRIKILENECRQLRDIEEIRQVRYRYWHAVREGKVQDLLDLFSKNPSVDFGYGSPVEGKEAVTDQYMSTVGNWKPGGQYPRGFAPEIHLTGRNNAKGIWLGEVHNVDREKKLVTHVGFIYDEEYIREKGAWKIKSLKISYTVNEYNSMVAPK